MNEYIDPKKILKTSSNKDKKAIKTARRSTFSHVSKNREEKYFMFITNKTWESTYEASVVFREIESSANDYLWLTHVFMSSIESGNMVYKKYMYHKDEKLAKKNYNDAVKIIADLRTEQEINNIPTATIPNMLWYALNELSGDIDLKPKSSGNIVYLRQDHNVEANAESRGNLFKNILYLDKADYTTIEHLKDGSNISNQGKNHF